MYNTVVSYVSSVITSNGRGRTVVVTPPTSVSRGDRGVPWATSGSLGLALTPASASRREQGTGTGYWVLDISYGV